MEKSDRYLVPSVQRAVEVLEILANAPKDASLSELANVTKLPKSSLFRILVTLEAQRMVSQDHEKKKFSLGTRLLELGGAKLRKTDLNMIVGPALQQLAQEHRESVYLGVLEKGQIVFLQQIEHQVEWKTVARSDYATLIHCTAIGQVLLSGLSSDEVGKIVTEIGLKRYTKRTITSEAGLQKRLARISSDGFAIADGEYRLDLCTVAGPVRGYSGAVVAALMIALPSSHASRKSVVLKLAHSLQRVGLELSRQLGYVAPWPISSLPNSR
jgi:DNA-binding IclR family transcriptional regulator